MKTAKEFLKELSPHDKVFDFENEDFEFTEDQLLDFAERYAKEVAKKKKKSEKINNLYGAFFDKVISDGQNPEEAAQDLGLL